jgi:hypothetical protein
MDLDITNFTNKHPIFILMTDELVNTVYTIDINNLIYTKCETVDDRRVFLMFLMMYFYTYLNITKI